MDTKKLYVNRDWIPEKTYQMNIDRGTGEIGTYIVILWWSKIRIWGDLPVDSPGSRISGISHIVQARPIFPWPENKIVFRQVFRSICAITSLWTYCVRTSLISPERRSKPDAAPTPDTRFPKQTSMAN